MAETAYKIGDFAKKVGLTTFTLRYYENEGLIIPKRDQAGRRYYTEMDVRWLGFLLHLKGTGMRMDEIKTYVRLRAEGDSTIDARKTLLESVSARAKAEIAELQSNLTILNHKVDWYAGKLDETISDDESFREYLEKMEAHDGEE